MEGNLEGSGGIGIPIKFGPNNSLTNSQENKGINFEMPQKPVVETKSEPIIEAQQKPEVIEKKTPLTPAELKTITREYLETKDTTELSALEKEQIVEKAESFLNNNKAIREGIWVAGTDSQKMNSLDRIEDEIVIAANLGGKLIAFTLGDAEVQQARQKALTMVGVTEPGKMDANYFINMQQEFWKRLLNAPDTFFDTDELEQEPKIENNSIRPEKENK